MSNVFTQAFILVVVLCGFTESWLFSGGNDADGLPEWDKLSATYLKYNGLPQNTEDAKSAGWKNTEACEEHGYFRGNRYILDDDLAVMLLFDSNGKIAGIQSGVLKSAVSGNVYKQASWVEDGEMLVVTAYFVDPNVICNGQRKQSEYLGDSLTIQVGPTIDSLMKIPLKENELTETKWVKGKCFWGMGQHYWYDISQNMNCDDYFPIFLLYNGGKLNAFGFVALGNLESSRYEHPPSFALGYFYQKETEPKCVFKLQGISTIHVYLEKRPYFNFC